MENKEANTEEIILKAAEEEFLENGYGNAKMLSIAKRAGVSHSMLHYYFRTKENMFRQIFHKKIDYIGINVLGIIDKHLPFDETVRKIVETQFDFVAVNPKLPLFALNEVVSNKENREMLIDAHLPRLQKNFAAIDAMLKSEAEKGTIRPISVTDFLLNIIAINISIFLTFPMLEYLGTFGNFTREEILSARRESNVQFVLNSLKKK